ncbi:MAG: hypothetical protein MJZ43_02700 [Bacteroidaceae bacterium]|nr:hypothetical protein [Bacteroidaceae bacterium]
MTPTNQLTHLPNANKNASRQNIQDCKKDFHLETIEEVISRFANEIEERLSSIEKTLTSIYQRLENIINEKH